MYLPRVSLLSILFELVLSIPHPVSKRRISAGPVIASNFADPAFIQLDGISWAFSTTSGGKNVPIAKSTDFNKWEIIDRDALPKENLPPWTTGNLWAPDVIQLVRIITSHAENFSDQYPAQWRLRPLLLGNFQERHLETLHRRGHVHQHRWAVRVLQR